MKLIEILKSTFKSKTTISCIVVQVHDLKIYAIIVKH